MHQDKRYVQRWKKREITKKFLDGNNEGSTILSGKEKIWVETHYVIVDKFSSELDKKIGVYSVVVDHFFCN